MAATVIGLDSFTQISRSRGWTKDQGQTQTTIYKGPIAAIDAEYQRLLGDPNIDAMETSKGDGFATLSITLQDDNDALPNTELNNDLWEFVGQDLTKNIRAHPTFNQNADQDDLEAAREYFESAQLRGAAPAGGSTAEKYYKLLLRGTSEFVRSAAILRRTVQVGPRSLVTASWKGVDRAWKLNGGDGSPNLRTTGDAQIIGAISEMPDQDNAKKQWLKRAPQIRQVGKRKFGIVFEWWFAKTWSEILYEGDTEDGNP